MKKIVKNLAILLLVVVFAFATGCAQNKQLPSKVDAAVSEESQKLLVYTSFYPVYDFSRKIGGESAEIINLVPNGVEPHDWEPSAADIAGLEKADIFVYSGAGMEHWVDKVLPTLQNKQLIIVEASASLQIIQSEDDNHTHGNFDPHVWLDPKNAKQMLTVIGKAFIQANPKGEAGYLANIRQWSEECDTLDLEFVKALSPLQNRSVMVAHEAFGYLCHAYDLNQKAAQGFSPDAEPDPARMAQLVDFAREHHIGVVFYEATGSPKVAETIARELGIKADALSPLEALTEQEQAAGGDYFSVMRSNLAALTAALSN